MRVDASPLLSIAIPTYNRAAILDKALERLWPQIQTQTGLVELIVSDNCSSDDTRGVVEKYSSKGLRVRYLRNDVNVGADLNCVGCYRASTGKYLWILGDDDFLVEGVLERILAVLSTNEIGLLHLKEGGASTEAFEVSENVGDFLGSISVNITFISVNIFRRTIELGFDLNSYRDSYLSLVPVFYAAALSGYKNIFFRKPVLIPGNDSSNNGGYNYFQVFVRNYLDICQDVFVGRLESRNLYEREVRTVFENHVSYFTDKLLIRRKRGNFEVSRAWSILLARYGKHLYFYGKIIGLWWSYHSEKCSDLLWKFMVRAKRLLMGKRP